MEDPIDQDHPAVQDITQSIVNHGWMILPQDTIDLVNETKEALTRFDQRQAQIPTASGQPIANHPRLVEASRVVREILPDVLHTPDGDKPEIPDDLIEEIGAILADHAQNR